MQPPTVSPPADADLKRLTYRALMLRGMACRQVECQTPSENQRDGARAMPCEASRQTLRDVISGRISDAVAFEAAIDRSLQQLALSQVTWLNRYHYSPLHLLQATVPFAPLVAPVSLGLSPLL